MKEFWDERYAEQEYAYGIEPNAFFAEQLDKLKIGRILLPAEGEGRNAVYAAEQGWEVVAFDISEEGRKKALELAAEQNVVIDYRVGEFSSFDFDLNSFDAVGLIFAHFPSEIRKTYHQQALDWLKFDGHLILEAFSKEHAAFQQENPLAGGPQNPDMLYSEAMLREDFCKMKSLEITQTETALEEGKYHIGKAAVIRLVGVK